jgi:hypothetical protein
MRDPFEFGAPLEAGSDPKMAPRYYSRRALVAELVDAQG